MKKKIYVILFCIALIFTLCLVAGAKNVEWSASEDGKTITSSNGDVYTYIYLNPSDEFRPSEKYSYENMITLNDYRYSVYSDVNNMNVIVLSGAKTLYYVKDEARVELESFRDGTYSSYGIADGYRLSKITKNDLLTRLDNASSKSYDVRELYNYERYSIVGFDITGAFSHEIGAIYIGSGYTSAGRDVMLYVNYQNLPNNYFSSTGEFSYREGTVTAYEVSNLTKQEVQELIDNTESWSQTYVYEDEAFTFDKDEISLGTSIAVLVIGIIALLAIPAVPVAIAAACLIKKRAEHPKRTLVLIASGGFLLLVTILLVIFIFL